MKLRKGDDIACPNGHLCGCVVCDIDDDRPITAEDFVADGHAEQASAWPGVSLRHVWRTRGNPGRRRAL
jgi:hypothetical protein